METLQYLQPSIRVVEPFHQLAPYMRNLNEADFSQNNFAKFADLVLGSSESSSDSDTDHQVSVQSACSESSHVQATGADGYTCCRWSACASPSSSSASSPRALPSVASEPRYLDDCSYSSSSYYNSSDHSSYPTSVASSTCGCDSECSAQCNWVPNWQASRADASVVAAHASPVTLTNTKHDHSLKRRNAGAAERYRRKLKGRSSNLVGALDLEMARNRKLKRQIQSKLALYGEFVALLAEKTNWNDKQLASIGERSLSSVLATVASPSERPSSSMEMEVGSELESSVEQLSNHLRRFRHIVSQCK